MAKLLTRDLLYLIRKIQFRCRHTSSHKLVAECSRYTSAGCLIPALFFTANLQRDCLDQLMQIVNGSVMKGVTVSEPLCVNMLEKLAKKALKDQLRALAQLGSNSQSTSNITSLFILNHSYSLLILHSKPALQAPKFKNQLVFQKAQLAKEAASLRSAIQLYNSGTKAK